MAKQIKIDKVEELRARIAAAKGFYLADFAGMNVAQATELRNRCRAAGIQFEVVKNTLTLRAVDPSVRDGIDPLLHGPTAIATSALLVFVDAMKELPATLLLRPANFDTLATWLYAEAARGTYEEGAIAALAIVVAGLLPVVMLARTQLGHAPAAPRPDTP